VLRRERIGLRNAARVVPASLSTEEGQKDLQPDVLVPTSGLPADLAAKVTQGKSQLLEKARAIFDYVFAAMRYDKTGTGWGRGDVLYVCDGQEAQLKQSSEMPVITAWSDFYVDGKGWISVDISEAWKPQEKRDYFYGSHDVNRIQFNIGRDLRLNLLQDGKPLSYFVYPYVEVDGQEYPNVSLSFSFADAVMAVAAKKIGVQ
jgi:transglutaminase-like putative cysteine protease